MVSRLTSQPLLLVTLGLIALAVFVTMLLPTAAPAAPGRQCGNATVRLRFKTGKHASYRIRVEAYTGAIPGVRVLGCNQARRVLVLYLGHFGRAPRGWHCHPSSAYDPRNLVAYCARRGAVATAFDTKQSNS
jgi:hypothetical protein